MSIYSEELQSLIDSTIEKFSDSGKTFIPTYLYIKQHKITKKLYFGKTSRRFTKMLSYCGSGKYWKAHIKEYGASHIETIWYCLFHEIHDIVEFALMFSIQEDIIKSKLWSNLINENGLSGGLHSEETKNKISAGNKGKIRSQETKDNLIEKLTGRKLPSLSEETKNKISVGNKGKIVSQDTRDKQSQSAKNRPPIKEETRNKFRIPRTEAAKEKIRGKNNKGSVRVSIMGVIYDCISDAAKSLGIPYSTVYRRIYCTENKYIGWFVLVD